MSSWHELCHIALLGQLLLRSIELLDPTLHQEFVILTSEIPPKMTMAFTLKCIKCNRRPMLNNDAKKIPQKTKGSPESLSLSYEIQCFHELIMAQTGFPRYILKQKRRQSPFCPNRKLFLFVSREVNFYIMFGLGSPPMAPRVLLDSWSPQATAPIYLKLFFLWIVMADFLRDRAR